MTAAAPRRSSPARPLRRVLVANRGEIAVRIVRACRDLGLESVVVHSDADADSLACQMADRAICIGGPRPAESYLNGPAIVATALAVEADAIHPGYGFLAENAAFADLCASNGITFVGPLASAIRRMGNKMEARTIAERSGLAVISGARLDAPSAAVAAASRIGYPVIVKAAAGGGGRGMRLARSEAELRDVATAAAAEAEAAFGDGTIYLERYVESARHVEVQVAFDHHGNGIHLGERDCTVQRRYQKLVEESPATAVPADARQEMAEAAVRVCSAVDYRGVGTVEFLYDQERGDFAFIEMNTRLQVEHPVTELVTGIDLVELQLRVAGGEVLPIAQESVHLDGHAIEFRLNAEDAEADFRPAAGTIQRLALPLGPGVRVDTHLYAGYRIPPYYDSLLAKLVVHGASRPQAVARARRAFDELSIEGVTTTQPFHRWLLEQPAFLDGTTSTTWTERTWPGRQTQ